MYCIGLEHKQQSLDASKFEPSPKPARFGPTPTKFRDNMEQWLLISTVALDYEITMQIVLRLSCLKFVKLGVLLSRNLEHFKKINVAKLSLRL